MRSSGRYAIGVLVIMVAACGAGSDRDGTDQNIATTAPGDDLYPDVIAASATRSSDGTVRFEATISSPYDSAARYADAWRVIAPDGTVLGVRELLHDHAAEQPFTRSLPGVVVPADVRSVTIEGRDLRNGWGGATVSIDVPE